MNITFGMCWLLILFFSNYTGFSFFVTHRVVKSVEFSFRSFAKHDVPIDSRLKVFGLDDKTAAILGKPFLNKSEWAAVFQTLSLSKPAAILIDSLFTSDLYEAAPIDLNHVTKSTRVVTGSFLSSKEIKYRNIVPSGKIFQNGFKDSSTPAWIFQREGSYIYGPSSTNLGFIDFVGHIQIMRPTSVPLLFKDRNGIVIPHVALHASTSIVPEEKGIRVDSGLIPVDNEGHTEINYLTPSAAQNRVRSLKNVITAAASGKSVSTINEGDTVLLIFNYSTANTDNIDSPFGRIPGGYVLMSLINSTLNGRWLQEINWQWPLAGAAITAGIIIGHFCPVFWFWLAVAGGSAAIASLGIGCFSFASLVVPWFFPLCHFAGSALTSYGAQRFRESRVRMYLEMEMATAAALQKNYFPSPDCSTDKYEIATFYHSADAVGGDWYTYYVYNNDFLYVHIGDVTGHGTSAALLASYAKGATDMVRHEYGKTNADFIPLEVIHTSLNNILSQADSCSGLMTMISVMINLKTGASFCLNSGHRPVLVNRVNEEKVESITSRTPYILGFREFPSEVVAGSKILADQDVLLLYSDGLLDVPVSRGIRCNEKILKKVLFENGNKSVQEIRSVLAATFNVVKNRPSDPFIDDVTFIVVRLKLDQKSLAAA